MIATPPPRTRLYWTCQLVGFGLYVALTVWQFLHAGLPVARAIVEPLFAASIGITATHLYRGRARRQGWLARGALALASRVLFGSVVLAAVTVLSGCVLEIGIYGDRPPSVLQLFVFATVRWTLIYLVWTSLYVALGLLRRRQDLELLTLRLEKTQKQAELRALKAQLNPHFLFNALNSIRALVADEPTRAVDAITELARMLRYTLHSSDEDLVSLDRELETVDDYLALESLRLGPRLVVEREISAAARASKLPAMLLLTLVENAIKHGLAQLPSGGTLRLRADVHDGTLAIDVEQPRPSRAAGDARDSNGVGLVNVQERVRLLFGEHASVTLDLTEEGRAHARARLPERA